VIAINRFAYKIKSCSVCGGRGVIESNTDSGVTLANCECVNSIENDVKLVQANIPEQYWNFNIDDTDPVFIKKNKEQFAYVQGYVNTLPERIVNGDGIWFFSGAGLGKSSFMTAILKKAIEQDFKSYYIRASHLISLKFKALRDPESAELLEYIVNDVDILALEEIEKIYLSENDVAMNNQLFYEFLSDVYDTKKSLLISSNKIRKEAQAVLPVYIQDRLRHLKSVIFTGMSHRGKAADATS
jgi:DNA replication protein DnaC